MTLATPPSADLGDQAPTRRAGFLQCQVGPEQVKHCLRYGAELLGGRRVELREEKQARHQGGEKKATTSSGQWARLDDFGAGVERSVSMTQGVWSDSSWIWFRHERGGGISGIEASSSDLAPVPQLGNPVSRSRDFAYTSQALDCEAKGVTNARDGGKGQGEREAVGGFGRNSVGRARRQGDCACGC